MCHFVLVFFSPFSIAITSLGEERAYLSAFRTFVRFVLVWILSVSSSSWGLGRASVCDCGTPWTFLLPFFRWMSPLSKKREITKRYDTFVANQNTQKIVNFELPFYGCCIYLYTLLLRWSANGILKNDVLKLWLPWYNVRNMNRITMWALLNAIVLSASIRQSAIHWRAHQDLLIQYY